jgi:hypothetical protein
MNLCLPPIKRHKKAGQLEPAVFLAGTIDMGESIDWQADTAQALSRCASIIYNPRRPDWDSSWEQSINDPQFNVQVNWELDMIAASDMVFMYFLPGSQSPITLLELGIVAAGSPEKLWVCCPDGFYRKGNVDIICDRYGIRHYNHYEVAKCAFRQQCERVYESHKSIR